MSEILKEVLKEREKIKKSFEFRLLSKDHQGIFMQGYELVIKVIQEEFLTRAVSQPREDKNG